MGNIVVGVDGSSCSREALRFASAEAALRGKSLQVLWAWQAPGSLYAMSALSPTFDPLELSRAARKAAERECRDVLGARDVDVTVVEGNPANALIEESGEADMLVVGSRGLGGFKGLMLGSVSQQCAAHARCPVVIVHEPAG
ncbi:MAG TPA: universal stress protein [Gaiellales bacterium]|nr:universal stress protein [Gaiellales bacterium]